MSRRRLLLQAAPCIGLLVAAASIVRLEAMVKELRTALASNILALAENEARWNAKFAKLETSWSERRFTESEFATRADGSQAQTSERRVLLTTPSDNMRPTRLSSNGIDAHAIDARILTVNSLNVTGDLHWHGQLLGFELPTLAPTTSPTPLPTRHPTFHPTREPTREPTHRPTALIETALIENGYALVARADGRDLTTSSTWQPCSTHWASSSTINEDKCGTCTTDMKHEAWATYPSNELMLCFGAGQTNCAKFTHNQGVSLKTLFTSHTAVTTTEGYTFASLRAALGVSSLPFNIPGGYWCGLNMALDTNGGCSQVDPNSKTCGSLGDIVRIGCIGDNTPGGFAGCQGGPDDYALGVGVSSCHDGGSCATIGCAAGSLHYRDQSVSTEEGAHFDYTAYIWVRV